MGFRALAGCLCTPQMLSSRDTLFNLDDSGQDIDPCIVSLCLQPSERDDQEVAQTSPLVPVENCLRVPVEASPLASCVDFSRDIVSLYSEFKLPRQFVEGCRNFMMSGFRTRNSSLPQSALAVVLVQTSEAYVARHSAVLWSGTHTHTHLQDLHGGRGCLRLCGCEGKVLAC